MPNEILMARDNEGSKPTRENDQPFMGAGTTQIERIRAVSPQKLESPTGEEACVLFLVSIHFERAGGTILFAASPRKRTDLRPTIDT